MFSNGMYKACRREPLMIQRLGKMDYGILIATLVMLGFGIVFVYSSSFAVAEHHFGGADFFLTRQLVRALLGLISFVVFMNVDYHQIGKLSPIALMIATAMLVYVLALPESGAVNGAKRWIDLGFVRFQVSELARIAIILALARQCDEVGEEIRDGKVLLRLLAKPAVVCALIVVEPDFSTAVLVGLLGLSILFMAGAKITHLALPVLCFIPLAAISVATTPYRLRRLMGFLNFGGHKSDVNYQVNQALIGLGNGGVFGVGLGEGAQKYFYLPEPHTDFVFAILGEETGFAGLAIVLAVFAFMVYRGAHIAVSAPDKMGRLMAFGFTFALALYVLLHTSVNTGLVPTTGVPLPFLSYGGMSLIFTMTSMGILLNISSQSTRQQPTPRTTVRRRTGHKRTARR
ncbi:MAG: putative lipid II flippase FtsW [Chitinivibrionales bacterium]|nr:putative lipid II flippase FtsW [Chitinivibrionales bacterium]MBD3356010.1 putative lipid II flippase FtsW [Chitinivibrionales bacterium]